MDYFIITVGQMGNWFNGEDLKRTLEMAKAWKGKEDRICRLWWRAVYFLNGRGERDCNEIILANLRAGRKTMDGCEDYGVLVKLLRPE